MKFIHLLFVLALPLCCFSQGKNGSNSIIGKWSPAFVRFDFGVTVDVKKDTGYISDSARKSWPADKAEAMGKKLIDLVARPTLNRMKGTVEEYFADSSFTETKAGRVISKGRFSLNANQTIMTRKHNNGSNETITIYWENGKLVMVTDITRNQPEKKNIRVVYERL